MESPEQSLSLPKQKLTIMVMERDFLGLSSKLTPIITVKKETNDDSGVTKVMKDWSFLHNSGSNPQLLSLGPSQKNRRRDSVNDQMLPSTVFSPTSVADQNQTTHYSSTQDQSFINSFINHQPLDGSPNMAHPVSVFPLRSSSNSTSSPAATQLTIFYVGSVSVYQDITPEMAEAIILLPRNEPQAKPVTMAKSQKPVISYFPAVTYPPSMPPTFLPSTSYSVSETVSGSNEVTGLEPTKTIASLASTHSNQTGAFVMAPTVGLQQTRKASLARFLEKRKERVINVSPYNLDKKSSIDRKTPMSEYVSSSQAHHLEYH